MKHLVAVVLVGVPLFSEGAILERLKNGENLTLAAIGTSLSAKNWGHWFQPTGDWLNGLGYPGKVTLSNRAVPESVSNTHDGGLVQLADVLAKDNPDAVFIEFGMNDAYLPYKISRQASRDHLQAMINQIRDWAGKQNQGQGKNVEIIVQTMNNCIDAHAEQRPELAHYYQGCRDVAQSNEGVLFIDTYSKWLELYNSQPDHTTWNRYVPDGIHPNTEGAKAIIVPSVQQALKNQLTGAEAVEVPVFAENARILFQGDSITDGNRGRNEDPNHILGHGYPFIIAAKFGARYPERKLTFLNRGISGNKVTDLAGRWQSDTLDLKPDVLSILIGINDSGHVPLDQYEQIYDKLLSDARTANPNIRFVLCEPFYLPKEGHQEGDARDQDVRKRQAIVAKLAVKHHAARVKLQKVFDDACQRAPASYWVWDAVHPTYSGHQLMADEWVRTVTQFYP